jgi:hypothetical protein
MINQAIKKFEQTILNLITMKKIIGIFSLSLIASIMLFNVNLSSNAETNTDVDLASLVATNVANAEDGQNGCFWTGYWLDRCWQGTAYTYECEPSYMYNC